MNAVMEEDVNSCRGLICGDEGDNVEGPPNSNRRIRSNSECDVVHRIGNLENYSLSDASPDRNYGPAGSEQQLKRWDLNYREAAIFLQEGENNDKFTAHPQSQMDLPAYMITHNVWFYLFTLAASLLLLSLAFFEEPAIGNLKLPIMIHTSLELVGLLVITAELVLKIRWLGVRAFVCHVRTMIEVVILVVMFAEALTVMVRQKSHIRVTRALRPVFLLDSYYCRGVRRFIRQIIQSLSPIVDMLVLLLFFILLFSMLGFYLFSNNKEDTYFQDIVSSFVNMFILLTSANFPDVMMPAYKKNRWAAAFFVIYICIELFLFMNIFLAVVYSTFIKIEKEKLKKLLLHRRKACASAFQLLVSSQNRTEVSARHFAGCMKYFRPRMSKLDVYLSFKNLNISNTGKLSEEEFVAVYDSISLKWQKLKTSHEIWSSRFKPPFNAIGLGLNRFVTWKCFEYLVYAVIVGNLVWILADTIHISVLRQQSSDPFSYDWLKVEKSFLWISIIFVAFYCVEILLKILGLGPRKYFSSGWNIFDTTVTLVALLGVFFQIISNSFYYIIVLRPLRVLRLFKLKRSFRDVFGTLVILFSRMVSLAVAMLLLYYFFAIIGMELFASYTDSLKNCCKNTSVEQYYVFNQTGANDGYYYLNNFDNLFVSSVTLFELTVVNNWWIIMEGYAYHVSLWSRVYFMIFYLIVMVVMTTTVAFVLEAFIFRIQYRQKMQVQDMDDHAIMKVDVRLSPEELSMCTRTDVALSGQWILRQSETARTRTEESLLLIANGVTEHDLGGGCGSLTSFRGVKMLSKNDFSLKMYSQEVQEWLAEGSPSPISIATRQRVCVEMSPLGTVPEADDPAAVRV